MEEQNIESSLITTIVNSDAKEIASDMIELSLDSVLDDGLLKDIPIIGILAKLYSTGQTIQGKIFEKKIIKFLYETEKTKKADKEKFNNKLNSDLDYRKKVGEQLLVILDRLDNIEKASVLGRLFKAFMEESIDLNMFQRLASVVASGFLPDLKKLVDYEKQSQWSSFTSTSLSNLGLVHRSYVKPEKFDEYGKQLDGSEYSITKLGIELLKLRII
tara:strand:- start:7903 stop:8550 length:648 start_codon:yes stop_codon:yes gene_type:complete